MKENIEKFKGKKAYAITAVVGIAVIASILILATTSIPISQVNAVPPAPDTVQTNTVEAQLSPSELTGRMTLYILPLEYGQNYQSGRIVNIVNSLIPNMAASHYTDLGFSLRGQYADEPVVLTEQNIPEDLRQNFKPGDAVKMTVIKHPADTVKVYVDPDVRKPDGTPVTVDDISPDWQFGNGITCCGFSLKDGTDVSAVFFVVDQAYDAQVMKQLDAIKTAASNLTS